MKIKSEMTPTDLLKVSITMFIASGLNVIITVGTFFILTYLYPEASIMSVAGGSIFVAGFFTASYTVDQIIAHNYDEFKKNLDTEYEYDLVKKEEVQKE